MNTYVEQLEEKRDLRQQMDGLAADDQRGIIFQEWSPGRTMVTLWSTEDGEAITIPRYMAEAAITTPRDDGKGFRFTAHPEKAPAYKLGDVKCFLHPDSDERKSGLLEAAGIAGTRPCPSSHHPSRYAMEQVARTKHAKQWQALEQYRQAAKEQEQREQAQKQLDATLQIATAAVGTKVPDAEA